MAYATGGLAVGSIRSTVRLSGVGFDADGNPGAVSNAVSVLTQKAGWTVGAGLEGRLFGNVTGKIEYLYMDFGTISTSVTNPFNATPVTLSSNSRITDNIVRVGLNYKLDPARGVYDVLAPLGAPLVYKALPYKAPSRIRNAGRGPVDLGRWLPRPQRGVRLWQVQYRYHHRRCHRWDAPRSRRAPPANSPA